MTTRVFIWRPTCVGRDFDYCLFWDNEGGNFAGVIDPDNPDWQHNLLIDPQFAGAGKGDYRLRPESPGLGSGAGGRDLGAFAGAPALAENLTQGCFYDKLQAAVDAAAAGDEIVVWPGTYTGAGNWNLDFRGKAITVRSLRPSDPAWVSRTIIKGGWPQNRCVVFKSNETAASVLDGFTLTGGHCDDGGGDEL